VLLVTAVVVKVPLERLPDPTDTGYIPHPDWSLPVLVLDFEVLEEPL
jgi:hypothetical protein